MAHPIPRHAPEDGPAVMPAVNRITHDPRHHPQRTGHPADRMREDDEHQNSGDAEQAYDGSDGDGAFFAAERDREIQGHAERTWRRGIGEAQRDQRDEHERVRKRRAERIEIGEEVQRLVAWKYAAMSSTSATEENTRMETTGVFVFALVTLNAAGSSPVVPIE